MIRNLHGERSTVPELFIERFRILVLVCPRLQPCLAQGGDDISTDRDVENGIVAKERRNHVSVTEGELEVSNRPSESSLIGPAEPSQTTKMPTVHLPSDTGVATLLSGRGANTLLRIVSSNGNYVLKIYGDLRYPVCPGLTAANRALAEFMALDFCRCHELPAPLPIAQRGSIVLMQQCVGDPVSSPVTEEIIGKMLSWLHRLHALPMPEWLAGGAVKSLHPVAARRLMERYIADHHDDCAARSVYSLFASTPAPVSGPTAVLHGDPCPKNWMLCEGTVYALDLEFFCEGNPVYDVGMLMGSLLNTGAFSPATYSLCADALRAFGCSLNGSPAALLCGLIIIAVSVPNDTRRKRVFGQIHEAIDWAGLLAAKQMLPKG